MHLHVLGSSGTYPSPGRPSSGFVVGHGSTNVVLDLGPGTFLALCDHLDLETIDAVVISHQHIDHCVDLFALYHFWAHGPRPRRAVPLLAPVAVMDRMEGFLERPGEGGFREVFSPDPVGDGDERAVGPLRLRFTSMDHSVPTVGTRIESEHRSLFYTGDTGPSGSWPDAAGGCTLMLAEASYLGDPEQYSYRQHLTAGQAGEIARRVGAKRLMLTHIPPHVDVTAAIDEAEKTFDRAVALAVPGATSEV